MESFRTYCLFVLEYIQPLHCLEQDWTLYSPGLNQLDREPTSQNYAPLLFSIDQPSSKNNIIAKIITIELYDDNK